MYHFSMSGSDFVEMFVGVGASAFVIYSVKQRKKHPVSFSSMKLMPWVESTWQKPIFQL